MSPMSPIDEEDQSPQDTPVHSFAQEVSQPPHTPTHTPEALVESRLDEKDLLDVFEELEADLEEAAASPDCNVQEADCVMDDPYEVMCEGGAASVAPSEAGMPHTHSPVPSPNTHYIQTSVPPHSPASSPEVPGSGTRTQLAPPPLHPPSVVPFQGCASPGPSSDRSRHSPSPPPVMGYVLPPPPSPSHPSHHTHPHPHPHQSHPSHPSPHPFPLPTMGSDIRGPPPPSVHVGGAPPPMHGAPMVPGFAPHVQQHTTSPPKWVPTTDTHPVPPIQPDNGSANPAQPASIGEKGGALPPWRIDANPPPSGRPPTLIREKVPKMWATQRPPLPRGTPVMSSVGAGPGGGSSSTQAVPNAPLIPNHARPAGPSRSIPSRPAGPHSEHSYGGHQHGGVSGYGDHHNGYGGAHDWGTPGAWSGQQHYNWAQGHGHHGHGGDHHSHGGKKGGKGPRPPLPPVYNGGKY